MKITKEVTRKRRLWGEITILHDSPQFRYLRDRMMNAAPVEKDDFSDLGFQGSFFVTRIDTSNECGEMLSKFTIDFAGDE